ncbi:MAG TPA: TonB-dependent receptor [Terriglobia bacterium]|nr:TonB-dependent receptor [Terriglobia bacterium]
MTVTSLILLSGMAVLSATGAQDESRDQQAPKLVATSESSPSGAADRDAESGEVHGTTRDSGSAPLGQVQVTLRSVDDGSNRILVSDADGSFSAGNLAPGRYELSASKEGFSHSPAITVELAAGQSLHEDVMVGPASSASPGSALVKSTQQVPSSNFFGRLFKAYTDDWKGVPSSGPAPPHRGYPSPESNPPYPFSDWPYGGSVDVGAPFTQSGPLMQAVWGGPHGEAIKNTGIQVYGWLDGGFNVSSSAKPGYANLPAAYDERPNSFQPDQEVLYIERQPDTVQTDHFDWGFRVANLWGIDYRFTTAKGIFSQQLLERNQEYGYDPVMVYADLYWGQVAQGLNIRVGRYISLPDIEAQLAPNNYTYSHSLLYTYDCYTQTGINGTLKLDNHWLVQAGISGGCEAAPFITHHDAKPTLNACVAYTWNGGNDNLYPCLNPLNDGKYAYNNLNSVYLTWYHKFRTHPSLHAATEWWYMWEKDTPNVNNPAAASLLEVGANGAVCANASELTCFAPEWAIVNYVEKQFTPKDYLSIRNEYFDDMVGQRTGFKSRYTEHLIGWGHWIGSTILFRPEVRFERSYDVPAYDNGTKKNQLTLAGDIIYFF